MKRFQTDTPKKNPTVPWIIAAVVALGLVLFLQYLLSNYAASAPAEDDTETPGQSVAE